MRQILILILAAILFSLNDANAYINPSTGGDFMQMLISIFIATKQFIKKYLCKIRALFTYGKNDKNEITQNKK